MPASPLSRRFAVGCLLTTLAVAQAPYPDRMYFKFNEGTGVGGVTANVASPGVGSANAVVTGHSLTPGVGFGGSGALIGTSVSPGTSNVNTGWATALGTGSWTISFRCDVSTLSTSTLYYVCGDSTAGSFRVFYNGVAGVGNVMIRGGLTDTIVPGAGVGGAHWVTFVYDASVTTMYGYLDTNLVATVAQSALNINGTGVTNFLVAGYTSASHFSNGANLDEFRMYSYALTPAQVAAGVGVELFDVNVLTVTQSGAGVGDLSIGLTNITPTGIEGWTLISFDVSGTAGAGPLMGIRPDFGTWTLFLNSPLADGVPFHFPNPSAFGAFPNSPYVLPPGAVSFLAGTSADFSVFFVNASFSYDSRSNVVRRTFN
jgi:hypothetical protein